MPHSEDQLTRPLNILLVEDSLGDAILVRKALQKNRARDCQVTHASSLAEGLKALNEHSFDVVLLDLSLPDSSGFEGLLNLQNLAPKTPIIILTAYADEAVALQSVLSGAQDYIFKDKLESAAIDRSVNFAIQRKRFEETLTTKANFDPLTGLPNRNLFENRLDMTLARHKRMGGGLAVFLLDLDCFKAINDTLGHSIGDQVLQQAGQRMTLSIRAYDTAARFGGDEFAIILDGLQQPAHAEMLAAKIIDAFAAPFLVNGQPITAGVSIGIALNLAGQAANREMLMGQADEAMYLAKLSPHSDFKIYSSHFESPELTSVVRLLP